MTGREARRRERRVCSGPADGRIPGTFSERAPGRLSGGAVAGAPYAVPVDGPARTARRDVPAHRPGAGPDALS